MDDKSFELITAMYSEMQKGFKRLDDEMKQGFARNEAQIRKTDARIEHEVMPKMEVLFDAVKANGDRIDRVEKKVDRLTERVDSQEFDIRLIKSQKAK